MPLRLNGSTSGYSQLDAPAIAGDQLFTLPGTGGTLDRLNRAGNVLQVVNATYSTQVTNSTNVYVDTGLTATITPTSSTSKILVLVHQAGVGKDNQNLNNAVDLRLLRGATQVIEFAKKLGETSTVAYNLGFNASTAYLDSPATTSAVTYKTQFRNTVAAATVYVQNNGDTSTITLMEIAA